ncbi:MAG: 6-oxopurine nucleoside phosphorylase [Thermoplasmatota archaeon]
MKIGVLTGSVLPEGLDFGERIVNFHGTSSSGPARLKCDNGEFLIIARHGIPPAIPPNMVEHGANLDIFRKAGVDGVISICSTGALRNDVPVPSLCVPEDYIDLFSGVTVVRSAIQHATPSFDQGLRRALVQASKDLDKEVRDGGVYIQTRGPRLETKAEVRMLAGFADIVGMNLGSECTVACEMDIPFAGMVTVDNYAHGINADHLDYRDILLSAASRWEDMGEILIGAMEILAADR